MTAIVNSTGMRPVWRDRKGPIEIRFAGRGEPRSAEDFLRQEAPAEVELAWARQIHSSRVLHARPGESGEGDVLVTRQSALALCIVTADCVPVLLSDEIRVAAVHAGWRGLVGGVLHAAVDRFPNPKRVTAWIGPAIGVCCYEVGEDVAKRIGATVHDRVIVTGQSSAKPHADLRATTAAQLREFGVLEIRHVRLCTRCEADRLHSYRRDGSAAGRNLALIWLTRSRDAADETSEP